MREEHEKQKTFREKIRIKREPELLQILDTIVDRVRSSQMDIGREKEKGDYAFIAGTKKLPRVERGDRMLVSYTCNICGNNDPNQFTSDISNGDVICLGASYIGLFVYLKWWLLFDLFIIDIEQVLMEQKNLEDVETLCRLFLFLVVYIYFYYCCLFMFFQEHFVELGAEKRKFEGEEDRNHFGPAPNALMPDNENLRTVISIG